jgi:hypothetical protein
VDKRNKIPREKVFFNLFPGVSSNYRPKAIGFGFFSF